MSSVILAILFLCAPVTGQISMQLLNATVGGSVLIHCSLSVDLLSLRWFYWQEDGSINMLFHWDRSGKIQNTSEEYRNRCQALNSEFSSGNISIRLDSVTVGDDKKTFFAYVGLYDEQKKVSKQPEKWCESTLQVSAPYDDVVLTVNSTTNSATCTARWGYPEPQVSWMGLKKSSTAQVDLQTNDTSLQQDPTQKTFSVRSSVSVKELQAVTCRIYNPHSSESTERTKSIGDNSQTRGHWIIGFIAAVTLLIIILLLWCCTQRIPCNQRQRAEEPAPVAPPSVPVGDGFENSVSLSGHQAVFRPVVRRNGPADSSTNEDTAAPADAVAAAEQREQLLKNKTGDETSSSESEKDK